MKEDLLGYSVEADSVQDFAEQLYHDLFGAHESTQPAKWLACLNPHSYAVAKHDSQFAYALRNADWLVPDGAGIVLASRLLGGRIRERITGSDVFSSLLHRMNEANGSSVFFLGATEETLLQIKTRMAQDFPNVRVVGTYSPPFRSTWATEELDAMISTINTAQPDMLWVGMTAPKQEKWIYDNLPRLKIRFAAAVGAVFDFYAGNVKRSHPLFQRLGLEWLPRLIQQPKRLWRRMFVSAPVFIWHVIRYKFRFVRN